MLAVRVAQQHGGQRIGVERAHEDVAVLVFEDPFSQRQGLGELPDAVGCHQCQDLGDVLARQLADRPAWAPPESGQQVAVVDVARVDDDQALGAGDRSDPSERLGR